MLGYLNSEIDDMREALDQVQLYIPPGNEMLKHNIKLASEFFDGLWAEGYFDNVE
jgi:hypothetical protein